MKCAERLWIIYKMQNKYCLPIIKKSQVDVLAMVEINLENYGVFEVWLDCIEDFDKEILNTLSKFSDKQFVFTLRRNNQNNSSSSDQRLEKIIKDISKTKFSVDLDIMQINLIHFAKSLKMENQLIISFHDYSRTPETVYLDKIIDKIRSLKPAIIKISTLCKQPADALKLMKYKRDFLESGQKHIVLGMGEPGKITRVFGSLWDNELIYIPVDESESSAPGQISLNEMNAILERT